MGNHTKKMAQCISYCRVPTCNEVTHNKVKVTIGYADKKFND